MSREGERMNCDVMWWSDTASRDGLATSSVSGLTYNGDL